MSLLPLSAQTTTRIAALYGLTAVGCGAFGAHGLQKRYPDLPARQLKAWETASSYLLVHAAVLLGVAVHPWLGRARWTAPLLIAGAGMFSGSIYALVLGSEGVRRVMGPVTPIGGSLMMAGWATMLFL